MVRKELNHYPIMREVRDWKLFLLLTTDANDIVRPSHRKAMLVILVDLKEQNG